MEYCNKDACNLIKSECEKFKALFTAVKRQKMFSILVRGLT